MKYVRIEFYRKGMTQWTDYNVDATSIRTGINEFGDHYVAYDSYYEIKGTKQKTRERCILEKQCSISVLPNIIFDKNDIGKVVLFGDE